MNNLHKQVKEICLVHCQHFTLVLHLKGIFFFFCKKRPPKNKTILHIGETDGRQGESESPIQNHCVMECVVAMEI